MNHNGICKFVVALVSAHLLLLGCSSSSSNPKEATASENAAAAAKAPTPAATRPAPAVAASAAVAKKPSRTTDQQPTALPPSSPAVETAPVPAPAAPVPVESNVPQPVPSPAVAPPQAAPPPPIHVVDTKDVTIPAGTEIAIRMIDSVDSGSARAGDTFRASVDSPLRIDNDVVLPKGNDVYVKVTQVSAAGDLRGKSELHMELDRVMVGKKSYAVESNSFESEGSDQGKKAVRNGAIGAAVGAAIGAIAGGGKGAAIGAGAGAGGGVGTTVLMKGDQVRVPSETRLVFTLTKPLDLTITPGAAPTVAAGAARLDSPPPTPEDSRRGGYPGGRRRRF